MSGHFRDVFCIRGIGSKGFSRLKKRGAAGVGGEEGIERRVGAEAANPPWRGTRRDEERAEGGEEEANENAVTRMSPRSGRKRQRQKEKEVLLFG